MTDDMMNLRSLVEKSAVLILPLALRAPELNPVKTSGRSYGSCSWTKPRNQPWKIISIGFRKEAFGF